VECLDNDPLALEFIAAGGWSSAGLAPNILVTRLIDLDHDPWPYRRDSIGAIVCVHWDCRRLLPDLLRSLRKGGSLLVETFGGHGENYRSLPPSLAWRRTVESDFDVVDWSERKVGPASADAVAVKGFVVKR
jgi:hypothetical protein